MLECQETSSFKPSLTSLKQPEWWQRFLKKRKEKKKDFQQRYSRRGRHLTYHTHLEEPPLPPQQQPMQIHLNMSIFTTQSLKK